MYRFPTITYVYIVILEHYSDSVVNNNVVLLQEVVSVCTYRLRDALHVYRDVDLTFLNVYISGNVYYPTGKV